MTDERCDLSDLPATQCACRIHGPKPTRGPDPTAPVEARTRAQHYGRCADCEEPIVPGEPIALVDGTWIHEDCA